MADQTFSGWLVHSKYSRSIVPATLVVHRSGAALTALVSRPPLELDADTTPCEFVKPRLPFILNCFARFQVGSERAGDAAGIVGLARSRGRAMRDALAAAGFQV